MIICILDQTSHFAFAICSRLLHDLPLASKSCCGIEHALPSPCIWPCHIFPWKVTLASAAAVQQNPRNHSGDSVEAAPQLIQDNRKRRSIQKKHGFVSGWCRNQSLLSRPVLGWRQSSKDHWTYSFLLHDYKKAPQHAEALNSPRGRYHRRIQNRWGQIPGQLSLWNRRRHPQHRDQPLRRAHHGSSWKNNWWQRCRQSSMRRQATFPFCAGISLFTLPFAGCDLVF